MAIKLFQITVGDTLILQLSGNPSTDGIGYNAPIGSLALVLGLGLFTKTGSVPTQWHHTSNTFILGGNFNVSASVPVYILGGRNDKDLRIIRNTVSVLEFTTQADADFATNVTFFPSHNLKIFDHIVKNNEWANFSTIISNGHLPDPVLDNDRKSVLIESQGIFGTLSYLGNTHTHAPTPSEFANNDTIYRTKREVSASRIGVVYNNPSLIIDMKSLDLDFGTLMVYEAWVCLINNTTGMVGTRTKTFTLKATSIVNRTMSILFSSDGHCFFEDSNEEFNFDLVLSNDPNSVFPSVTNNLKNSISINGLVNGENYNIVVWVTRKNLDF